MATAGVQIEGLDQTQLKMRGFARRIILPEPALEAGMSILEEGERDLFEALGGKYVQSGDLRGSLTESSAMGAIREAHGQTLSFGSSIWYAHFQRRIGGPSGKPRGRKRVGRSQVLQASRVERAAVREAVLAYVMRGGDA